MSSKNKETKPNSLINEKSPYLLQHAYNPVDWHPWGKKAFLKAKKENKPIFLSIGYSTCHWCHVMEKDSFIDPEMAELINDTFVPIKVDREERPDIDNIYMTTCQIISGTGGWPLTILMSPDKKPFFATTYLPKESGYGRVGLRDLIKKIKELWEKHPDELLRSGEQVAQVLNGIGTDQSGHELDRKTISLAYKGLSDRFDPNNGGFGDAPKFPAPHNLLFLLRYWKRSGDARALDMVERTLQAMRLGGIFDHVGFGFHRYSTDANWKLPHFEKMLYDQALLAMAYAESYLATGKEEYGNVLREIFTYVLRDMTSHEGGFYSAEDADSEDEEGRFYLWRDGEIRLFLTEEDSKLVRQVYNINLVGNFQEEVSRKKIGKNILYLKEPLEDIASGLDISEDELENRLEHIRLKMLETREKRIHPDKDDKILTDWNGLMIAALAKGARALGEPEYEMAARKAADFIMDKMMEGGRLLHRYRDGESAIPANVSDYSFFIWGLIELYEAIFDEKYLENAIRLQESQLEHFWDKENGGFFFTANDSEELLIRQKEIYDGAMPSGNSAAMLNLVRLGRMVADIDFEKKAGDIGKAFSKTVLENPGAYTLLMSAADFILGPSYEVVIVGNPQAEDTTEMINALRTNFIPNMVVIFKPEGEESGIDGPAGFSKEYSSLSGKATAYVCQDFACKSPTTDIREMLKNLGVNR